MIQKGKYDSSSSSPMTHVSSLCYCCARVVARSTRPFPAWVLHKAFLPSFLMCPHKVLQHIFRCWKQGRCWEQLLLGEVVLTDSTEHQVLLQHNSFCQMLEARQMLETVVEAVVLVTELFPEGRCLAQVFLQARRNKKGHKQAK